ncbi:MAG: twin-arginine translocation signal domain-containing protein, partial [Halobacteriota archaeon]
MPINRREFLKAGALGAGAAYVPPHNFDKYDFGAGPAIVDRLNQGPFPADLYPSWNVVMGVTPSD